MNHTVTSIHRRVRFGSTERKEVLRERNAASENSGGRIPRVARLLALAIRLEGLLAEGRVPNYAALAKLAHVTRARITQITSLTLLAPEIQEQVLFSPPVRRGPDPLTERDLRPIVAELSWAKQRLMWAALRTSADREVE